MGLQICMLGLIFLMYTPVLVAHGGSGGLEPGKKEKPDVVISKPIFSMRFDKELPGKLILAKAIEDYHLRVKVISVNKSLPDGGSHNLLVNIKHQERVQYGLAVTTKVVSGNGHKKTKPMLELGDWYLGGFDLETTDKHQITVMFKTAEGKIYSSEIAYP